MREPAWRIRLWDMLASAEKIQAYTSGLTKDEFLSNGLVVDAVLRNVEIIGMASRHVPEAARAELPEIAWKQIWGMRNRLAHEYSGIDLDVVWETINSGIPELIALLRPIVSSWTTLED